MSSYKSSKAEAEPSMNVPAQVDQLKRDFLSFINQESGDVSQETGGVQSNIEQEKSPIVAAYQTNRLLIVAAILAQEVFSLNNLKQVIGTLHNGLKLQDGSLTLQARMVGVDVTFKDGNAQDMGNKAYLASIVGFIIGDCINNLNGFIPRVDFSDSKPGSYITSYEHLRAATIEGLKQKFANDDCTDECVMQVRTQLLDFMGKLKQFLENIYQKECNDNNQTCPQLNVANKILEYIVSGYSKQG